MSAVDGPTVHLRFPARADFLLLGRLALSGLARAHPMSEEVLADLKLGLTEACGNVVRHAYPGGEGAVDVTISVADGIATIVVSDDGRGVEAARQAATTGGAGDGESGMGLAIMRAIADDLEIGRGATDGGTVVRITKRLDPPPVPDRDAPAAV